MSVFRNTIWNVPAIALLALTAACGGGDQPATDTAAEGEAPATQVTTPAEQPQNAAVAPAPAGEVIEVRMVMPGGQNPRYEPAKITAKQGDVVRFVNVENVHNVHFPQASNPAGAALPPPSPYLTQPGQTYDLKVELPAGTYDFICDPHAAMGMAGELTVTQ